MNVDDDDRTDVMDEWEKERCSESLVPLSIKFVDDAASAPVAPSLVEDRKGG
jgi:hypothetical protein